MNIIAKGDERNSRTCCYGADMGDGKQRADEGKEAYLYTVHGWTLQEGRMRSFSNRTKDATHSGYVAVSFEALHEVFMVY